jgi:predicted DNA-binding transcriptional regulator AlpA
MATIRPEVTSKVAASAAVPTLNEMIELAAHRAAEAAVRQFLKNQPLPKAEWFNTEQAAAYIGFSTEYLEIARHRDDGTGPKYIKHPRAVRYRRSDLDAWMEQHRKKTA